MELFHRDANAHRFSKGVELADHGVVRGDFEIVFLAGRDLADGAQQAAHLVHGVIIVRLVARLDKDGQAAVPAAEPIQPGRDGDDGEVVLVAPECAAFGFEHADDRVIEAVDLQALADGRTVGKDALGQAVAQDARTSRAPSTSISSSRRPSCRIQFRDGKLPVGLPEELDGGRGLFEAGFHLAAPEPPIDADGECQGGFALNRQSLWARVISLRRQYFSKPSGPPK